MQLQLTGMGFTHAGSRAGLAPLDLTIAHGEHVAIIGPSGAGKTTLLRLLGCQLKPTQGQYLLDAQAPWQLSARNLRELRSRIGLIHQQPPLPPRQRVISAIGAGRLGQWSLLHSLRNWFSPQDLDGPRRILTQLDISEKLFERCDQLSGGQLQRVGIARVLYQQAQLILADEPVSAMDPHLAQHTLHTLTEQARQHSATLVASLHNVDLALSLFPRVIGLRDGVVAFDLPSNDVSPAQLKALYANERLGSPVPNSPAVIHIPRC